MILAPDDIEQDQHVCIHSRSRRGSRRVVRSRNHPEVADPSGDDFPVTPGVPMRVLATSLPFVLCAVLEPRGEEAGPVIVDIRGFQLSPVADEFVAALREFGARNAAEQISPDGSGGQQETAEDELSVREHRESR